MGWNFDAVKEKESHSDNMWTSYSDLFLMLSVVFLMLYVVASLRSGTDAIQQKMEYQRVAMKAQDYKEQNRVYDTLKQEYLKKQATPEEQEQYRQLMDKLSLLQDEARQEKNRLSQLAKENEEKETALNHYQQLIRNIINANLLAKSGLQQRDEIIESKRQTIKETKALLSETEGQLEDRKQQLVQKEKIIQKAEKRIKENEQTIQELTAEVESKKSQIQENNAAIEETKRRLAREIQKLKKTESDQEKLKEAIANLRTKSVKQIKKLQDENQQYSSQLNQTNQQLEAASSQLQSATKTIESDRREKERLAAQLQESQAQFERDIGQLKDNFAKSLAAKEAAHRKAMENEKLTAGQREAAEKKYRDEVAKERENMNRQIADLSGKVQDTQGQLKDSETKLKKAQAKAKEYEDYVAALQKEKEDLSTDLKRSKEILEAKRKLADRIKKSLKKAGVEAEVDDRTGDVLLTFGNEYFDTSRADLKPGMQKILEKFVPVYAKSLFQDQNIAKNIEFVEVVGFASPTFKGKYIDPSTLKAEDRSAVDYNMDLSYQRARSIFRHMFDTEKMQYQHQKELLPIIKVTGRSFLAEGARGRDLNSGISPNEACKHDACKKQQRVIIRFDLKE